MVILEQNSLHGWKTCTHRSCMDENTRMDERLLSVISVNFLDDLHACNFGLQKTTYLSHFWALLARMQAPLIDIKKYILYKKISACMCASF